MKKKVKSSKKEDIKKILKYLKEGDKSSSKIANLFNRNYYDTLKLLGELEQKNKIEKVMVGRYTIWKVKK